MGVAWFPMETTELPMITGLAVFVLLRQGPLVTVTSGKAEGEAFAWDVCPLTRNEEGVARLEVRSELVLLDMAEEMLAVTVLMVEVPVDEGREEVGRDEGREEMGRDEGRIEDVGRVEEDGFLFSAILLCISSLVKTFCICIRLFK